MARRGESVPPRLGRIKYEIFGSLFLCKYLRDDGRGPGDGTRRPRAAETMAIIEATFVWGGGGAAKTCQFFGNNYYGVKIRACTRNLRSSTWLSFYVHCTREPRKRA